MFPKKILYFPNCRVFAKTSSCTFTLPHSPTFKHSPQFTSNYDYFRAHYRTCKPGHTVCGLDLASLLWHKRTPRTIWIWVKFKSGSVHDDSDFLVNSRIFFSFLLRAWVLFWLLGIFSIFNTEAVTPHPHFIAPNCL